MEMKKSKVIIAIAALMFLAVPGTPRTQSTVVGVTVPGAPICKADDLNAESQALIQRWWELNQKINAKTLTSEEFQEGQDLIYGGRCGLVQGDVPVTIKLLDGLDYLGVFPDGITFIFKRDGFIRDTE